MRESLGLVETIGLSNAILVADAMSKTANINIIGLENSKGSGYMTIKITGDVGAVNAAVACGKQIAVENNSFVTAKVIPRPASNIEVSFCQLDNKKEDVSKENNSIEIDDNKENIMESSIATKIEEAKVEEVLVKAEVESNKTEEVLDNQSSPEQKALNTEKGKPRRSNKK